ncbi:hypothetical protein [Anaeroselena agilis]|uniref:Uncharacterized protein n=1 Tax=Anaeroselena agilis TaxID=3063788 RepID=A0ABU3P466_9FIRM|nr:hypothetical protein [Selenomonadales bacterium 4137-cl]
MRKILICTLIAILAFSGLAAAQSNAEMTVLDKAAAVEKLLYGTEQTGSLVERAAKIERDMYGRETNDPLITKVDRVYGYLKENSAGMPSFTIKLNAVEWMLSHDIGSQPVKVRLENLERVMFGSVAQGSFDGRLTKLVQLAFPAGQVEVESASIVKDSLVKIKITTPLDSKSNRTGDAVSFQVAEDVYVGGVMVIGKGASGTGKVTKVEPARNFGRDAKLEISFDNIVSIDGTTIETILGEKAKEETKSMAKAAGATVAGLVVLGPIGIVGGAFVQGQDITIPAGTMLYIQTKADSEVYGIKTK